MNQREDQCFSRCYTIASRRDPGPANVQPRHESRAQPLYEGACIRQAVEQCKRDSMGNLGSGKSNLTARTAQSNCRAGGGVEGMA